MLLGVNKDIQIKYGYTQDEFQPLIKSNNGLQNMI